jgi:GAF domain-containing protein
VFLSNPTDQAWLRGRASVLAQNLRVMACLPLIVDGLLLGCAYVDSDEDGKLLSELDAEILAAFADQAAMTLAAADLQTALSRIESWVAVDGDERHDGGAPAPQWAALRAVAEVP